jgi:hypothetical protein
LQQTRTESKQQTAQRPAQLAAPGHPDACLSPSSCSESEFMSALTSNTSLDWTRKGGGESFKITEAVHAPASQGLVRIYARTGPTRFAFLGHRTMTHAQIMTKVSDSVKGVCP